MRILDIRERAVPISRYSDSANRTGGLTTSIVAVVTDAVRDGAPVIGFGFGSMGRFAQGGLIRERFAPRLLAESTENLAGADGVIDPFRAWDVMMAGEKPGGHGERCVAVGALDMALWDAAAKLAGLPLYVYLARRLGRSDPANRVRVYAGGGYRYPQDDLAMLAEEIRTFAGLGYTHAKIKIGGADIGRDLTRIETAAGLLAAADCLAVDAMNGYAGDACLAAADALAPYGLWWFEDICDPHDFDAQAAVAAVYAPPIAAGEALFSHQEAAILDRLGGLRRDRDVLVFDPVHCYGMPGYLNILDLLLAKGWSRNAFWPHGGHMMMPHVVAALGLGGAEVNPLSFQPFGGLGGGLGNALVGEGYAALPEIPGIGFEARDGLHALFRALVDG